MALQVKVEGFLGLMKRFSEEYVKFRKNYGIYVAFPSEQFIKLPVL